MILYLKLPSFWVQLFPRITKQKSLAEIAMAEGLDEFVKIESCNERQVEYCTIHGCRIKASERLELNLFVVLKKGLGFAKAVLLPYVYSPNHKFHHPRLVVTCNSTDAATVAGYAKAVELPYQLYSRCDSYIQIPRSLVVYINSNNEEATSAGYANAVPVPNISSESVGELARLLRLTPVSDCSLFIAERDSDLITILFTSTLVATEVAYMLRGSWDELNSIDIYQPDSAAVQNALALVKLELGLEEIEYCTAGECCLLEDKGGMRIFGSARAGSSVMLAPFFVDDRSLA